MKPSGRAPAARLSLTEPGATCLNNFPFLSGGRVNLLNGALTIAYGPFPGIELFPYFLALMAWLVLALFSMVLAPLKAMWRRLRGGLSMAGRAKENMARGSAGD